MKLVPMYPEQRLQCHICLKMRPVVYAEYEPFTYICKPCFDDQVRLTEKIVAEILDEEEGIMYIVIKLREEDIVDSWGPFWSERDAFKWAQAQKPPMSFFIIEVHEPN